MEITISQWIFNGSFWFGFIVGVGISIAFVAYAVRNFKVF
jgi:hypothetical protein